MSLFGRCLFCAGVLCNLPWRQKGFKELSQKEVHCVLEPTAQKQIGTILISYVSSIHFTVVCNVQVATCHALPMLLAKLNIQGTQEEETFTSKPSNPLRNFSKKGYHSWQMEGTILSAFP